MPSRNRSSVWNIFSKISPDKAKCSLCLNSISVKGGSISNLSRHIKLKHPGGVLNSVVKKRVRSPSESPEPPCEEPTKCFAITHNLNLESSQQYEITEIVPVLEMHEQQKVINQKLGFIGGGNMAKAICEGMVSKGRAKYSQVYVSGPHIERLNYWKEKGAKVTTHNGLVVDESDVIFIAVKPHILAEAVSNMFKTCTFAKASNKLFISILAGTTLEVLENVLLQLEGSRVVRAMPNTALTVGKGCVAFSPGQHVTEDDIDLVKSIFEVSGICQLVPESMINAIGALSGSGPAYIYLVIEALSDGGLKMGIPREMATTFAAQTVLGAAEMVLQTGKHTGVLKDEVCSTGGTTICGVHELEKQGVRSAFMNAIEAAYKRSVELGQKK